MNDLRRDLIVLNAVLSKPGSFLGDLKAMGLSLRSVMSERDSAEAAGMGKGAWEKSQVLLNSSWPEDEEDRASRASSRIICLGEDDFPSRLLDSSQAPSAIYVRGGLLPGGPSVAIVGTRRCSPYGVRVAGSLARRLAERSIPVISGGALGIDGAAHSGAIDGGGCTAAVLGTGVDVVYPWGHEELFSSIVSSGGALISQFPMGSKGQSWHFPQRNAVIASLSSHVVVVESPMKGGAMITASLAADMARDIWSVPGSIDQKVSAGSNRLLFDGAQTLWNIDDFVSIVSGPSPKPISLFHGEEESRLLEAVRNRGKATLDDLAERSSMTLSEAMAALVNLEAQGKIYRSGPGRWSAVP